MYQQELTDRDGYELFRRAIVERSDDAWRQIYARYRPLLLAWARQSHLRTPSGEPAEDLADWALARAWAALSPSRFAQFANLAALMGYLRNCVVTTVIDASRVEASHERIHQRMEADPVATPEQIVVRAAERAALWQMICHKVATEQEQIVLVESFQLTLTPRQILERHAEHFESVAAIYNTKRNLLNRLMRCHELQRLHEELHAA